MFAISAVIAHYAGSNISGGGYYLLMLLVGLSLTALVNIGLHNGPLEWIGCLVMVLQFGLTRRAAVHGFRYPPANSI
jgi:FtsH-binding integral membrane protein